MADCFGQEYKVIRKLGEGCFSEVFEAEIKKNRKKVAIKKLFLKCSGIDSIKKLSEIESLSKLQKCPFIVKMSDVLFDFKCGSVALVMEKLEISLLELIRSSSSGFSEKHAIFILYQLLRALDETHSLFIVHRDIKPENCMINPRTLDLKIIDFGSSKYVSGRGPYTEYVSTRWYRAPECLITDGFYGSAIDIWAAGCILFEMLTLKPLFPGNHSVDQLLKIHDILGSPSEEDYEFFRPNRKITMCFSFPHRDKKNFQSFLPGVSSQIIDLINGLLRYNPIERLTAQDALNHPLFVEFRRIEQLWNDSGAILSFGEFFLNYDEQSILKIDLEAKRKKNIVELAQLIETEKKKQYNKLHQKVIKKSIITQSLGYNGSSISKKNQTTNEKKASLLCLPYS